jgi:hypothetical protein
MLIKLVALVFVESLKTIMPLGFSKGSTCRSGTSLRGVAQELIAQGLAAAGQRGLRHARASEWEAEVRAACQIAMEIAVGQAAIQLPPEAVGQAADNLATDLEHAGASGWLADVLAHSILSGAVTDRVRDELRTTLGSRWDHLATQGIDLTRLIEAFPEAVVDDLLSRARPGEPLFQILQIMLLREEVAAVTRKDLLREPTTNVRVSFRAPPLTTPADLTFPPSSQADVNIVDGKIVEATALVMSQADPTSLLDARQRLAELLSELVSGVYWRHVDVTSRTIAVEGIVDHLLTKDAGGLQLLPARAYLRGRQGRHYDALADYAAYLPVAGEARGKVLADAGAMLMTLGHYSQARQVIRQAQASGLSSRDLLRTRQHELWIDDYQGRHMETAHECRRLMQAAQ